MVFCYTLLNLMCQEVRIRALFSKKKLTFGKAVKFNYERGHEKLKTDQKLLKTYKQTGLWEGEWNEL